MKKLFFCLIPLMLFSHENENDLLDTINDLKKKNTNLENIIKQQNEDIENFKNFFLEEYLYVVNSEYKKEYVKRLYSKSPNLYRIVFK